MLKTSSTLVLGFFVACSAAIAVTGDALPSWSSHAKSGDEAFAVGNFAAAEAQYHQALEADVPKSNLPGLEVKYTNAMMSQGRFEEAGKELKKTLSTAKSVSGADSVDYAEALDLQAWMYQANGDMEKAIASLQQSISILDAKAPGSSDLADAYEHMGLLQDSTGSFDQSQTYYSKALDVRQKLVGANSVEVADLNEALGQIALHRGNAAEARSLLQGALRVKECRGEPWKQYAPEPTDRVVVFHYIPGGPGCEQGSFEGTIIQRVTANGITVEAGISQKPSEYAKTTRALVRIRNNSQYDVDVLPQSPTFIQVTPFVEVLKPLNAQELASRIEKKGESKAKWIKFWGADATTPVTTYAYSQGNVPVYGYVPNSFGWTGNGYASSSLNSRGRNFNSTTTATTMVPDYQARAEAYAKAERATTQSRSDAQSIRENALGPNRLLAGGTMEGSLDFEYSKYKKAILRIPIGNAVYEFRFE